MITTSSKSLAYIKKSKFTGSYLGMRYLLCYEEEDTLAAYIWPGPYAYASTNQDKIVKNTFPFTEEGRDQSVDWLNKMYIERKAEWDKVNKSGLAVFF